MNKRIFQTTFLTLFLLLLAGHLSAQGWERPFPSTGVSTFSADMLITNDDAYIALGNIQFGTVQAVKTDFEGNVIWNKEYHPGNSLTMHAIINTTDGGYAMAGEYYFSSTDHGVALYKLDSEGDSLWLGGYGCCLDHANDLIQTDDGGYLLVGYQKMTGSTPDSLVANVMKVDANGVLLWRKTFFELTFPILNGFHRIIKKSNGNYLLLGSDSGEIKLVEIDNNGDTIAERFMENPDDHSLYAGDFIETLDGGLLVGAGHYVENSSSIIGGYLWKLDNTGNLLWMKVSDQTTGGVYSLSENEQGELFIGRTSSIEKRDSEGNLICALNSGNEKFWGGIYVEAVESGSAIATLSFRPDAFSLEQYLTLVKMDSTCHGAVDMVRGNVNIDADGDCIYNGLGTPLNNWLVELNNGQISYYALSDTNGNYAFSISPGDYELSLHPPVNYWESCSPGGSFPVGPSPDTVIQDLQAIILEECPFLVVDLASPPLRPCMVRSAAISYANLGPSLAENAYIQLMLDNQISLSAASVPYIQLPDNVYQFELGDVAQGETGQIALQLFLDCEAELGTTVCMQANIYPDTLCGEQAWTGPVIKVEGNCNQEDITFNIKNIGSQDMTAPLQYVVVEDHVMYMSGDFDLDAGQSEILTIPNQHGIYVARAEQEPDYPYGNFAIDLVAFCENPNIPYPFSTDYFFQFPYDDGLPTIDLECVLVTDSYDPNQKTATPAGYGERHFIEANTPIEYHIDFQNTGTDTAYNVVIRDTLSEYMDLQSLRAGAASHAYDLKIEGAGVLVFTFPNINLLDSLTNEPLSHGFVEYKIGQLSNLPHGTEIENTAAIYFDFNDPILTNTTLHTVGEAFITVAIDEIYEDQVSIMVFPNPVSGQAFLQLKGDYQNAQMKLFNALGKEVQVLSFENGRANLRTTLASGVYFFQVWEGGTIVGTGKLVFK